MGTAVSKNVAKLGRVNIKPNEQRVGIQQSARVCDWGRRLYWQSSGGCLVHAGARVRALLRYTGRGSWGHLEHLAPEVRDSVEVILGDVRDAQCMRNCVRGCDVVFHLAVLGIRLRLPKL